MINPKEQFKTEVESTFILDFLRQKRRPLDIAEFRPQSFLDTRVNHYLIKLDDSNDYVFGEVEHDAIRKFVKIVSEGISSLGLEQKDRYCFLTIDQGWIEPKKTLRTAGWHVDGMQGDEVPVKRPGDLTFVWSDVLPTVFAVQEFDVGGLDPSVHNVFDALGRQIKEENILPAEPFRIYAINSYHVHAATEAKDRVYRKFVRLSYTYTPVTSVKMDVNPAIKYNYAYHTTSGEIPSHLK